MHLRNNDCHPAAKSTKGHNRKAGPGLGNI